jgi:hypothetical protein
MSLVNGNGGIRIIILENKIGRIVIFTLGYVLLKALKYIHVRKSSTKLDVKIWKSAVKSQPQLKI